MYIHTYIHTQTFGMEMLKIHIHTYIPTLSFGIEMLKIHIHTYIHTYIHTQTFGIEMLKKGKGAWSIGIVVKDSIEPGNYWRFGEVRVCVYMYVYMSLWFGRQMCMDHRNCGKRLY